MSSSESERGKYLYFEKKVTVGGMKEGRKKSN